MQQYIHVTFVRSAASCPARMNSLRKHHVTFPKHCGALPQGMANPVCLSGRNLQEVFFLLRIRAIVEPDNQGNEDSSFSETSGAWTQCSAKMTQVHHDRKEIERQAICKQQEQRNKNELVINTMRVGTKSSRNHGAHACGRQLHDRLVSVVQIIHSVI